MKLRNLATIYIFDEDRVLMMYRVGSRVFNGALWAGIGGHFEKDELNDPTKCILRELFEETGITEKDIKSLNLKYITTRRANDEIRQQYIFTAKLINRNVKINPCDEGKTKWIPVSEVINLEMSFTNGECLKHFLSTGKDDSETYSGIVYVVDNKPSMIFNPLRSFSTTY